MNARMTALTRIRQALKGARGLALDSEDTALDNELERAIADVDVLMAEARYPQIRVGSVERRPKVWIE